MEVPATPWAEGSHANGKPPPDPQAHAPLKADWHPLPGTVEHTFTHFHLVLEVWTAEGVSEAAAGSGAGQWVAPAELGDYALPTMMKKVIRHARKRHTSDGV